MDEARSGAVVRSHSGLQSSPKFLRPRPQQFNTQASRLRSASSSAFSPLAKSDDDWSRLPNLADRRRVQNRIAQRVYRNKLKIKFEEKREQAHEYKSTSQSTGNKHNDMKSNMEKVAKQKDQTSNIQHEGGQRSSERSSTKHTHQRTLSPKSSKLSQSQSYSNIEGMNGIERPANKHAFDDQEIGKVQEQLAYPDQRAVPEVETIYTYSSQHAPMFWIPANSSMQLTDASTPMSPPTQTVMHHDQSFTTVHEGRLSYFPTNHVDDSLPHHPISLDPTNSRSMAPQISYAPMPDLHATNYDFASYQEPMNLPPNEDQVSTELRPSTPEVHDSQDNNYMQNRETEADGSTPLHAAARYHQPSVAALLISKGAAPTVINRSGQTPLHISASLGNLALVQLFLTQHVAIDATDNAGQTPLMTAAAGGHIAVISVLLDAGARMDIKDQTGKEALHHAAEHGYIDIVEKLIEKGADVNARDWKGSTALHGAVIGGWEAVVKVLVDAGADVNAITVV